MVWMNTITITLKEYHGFILFEVYKSKSNLYIHYEHLVNSVNSILGTYQLPFKSSHKLSLRCFEVDALTDNFKAALPPIAK